MVHTTLPQVRLTTTLQPLVLQLASAFAYGVTLLEQFRIGKREAGLGSLGRQRCTAVVDNWCGGILAREAKVLAPSAWLWWDETRKDTTEILSLEAPRRAGTRSVDANLPRSTEEQLGRAPPRAGLRQGFERSAIRVRPELLFE